MARRRWLTSARLRAGRPLGIGGGRRKQVLKHSENISILESHRLAANLELTPTTKEQAKGLLKSDPQAGAKAPGFRRREGLHTQHDLADMDARFHPRVSFGGFAERKDCVDDGAHLAGSDQRPDVAFHGLSDGRFVVDRA
jgi:hypothetical protein